MRFVDLDKHTYMNIGRFVASVKNRPCLPLHLLIYFVVGKKEVVQSEEAPNQRLD